MKIIDLLNKIANGEEPPRRIYYKGNTYEYNCIESDYDNIDLNEYLFDSHIVVDILNDEVEILETTITMNKKIEKLEEFKDLKQEIANIHVKVDEIIDRVNAND